MAAFYFGHIKQLVSAFGAYFSDIHVIRRRGDSVNGPAVNDIRVPIAFSARSKWYQQILEGTRDKQTKWTLPRLGFNVTGFSYDSARKASRNQSIKCKSPDGTTQVLAPVPWNVDLELYIAADNLEDCLQIVEQILPQFNPDVTFKLRGVFDTLNPVPVSLMSISTEDNYEGSYSEQRLVVYTLTFVAKLNLYGEITEGHVIEETDFAISSDFDGNDGEVQTITKDPYGNYIASKWELGGIGQINRVCGGRSPEVMINDIVRK